MRFTSLGVATLASGILAGCSQPAPTYPTSAGSGGSAQSAAKNLAGWQDTTWQMSKNEVTIKIPAMKPYHVTYSGVSSIGRDSKGDDEFGLEEFSIGNCHFHTSMAFPENTEKLNGVVLVPSEYKSNYSATSDCRDAMSQNLKDHYGLPNFANPAELGSGKEYKWSLGRTVIKFVVNDRLPLDVFRPSEYAGYLIVYEPNPAG